MQTYRSIDLIPSHQPVWLQVEAMIANQKVAQSLMLIGPQHLDIPVFSNRLMALLLCETHQACGRCDPCNRVKHDIHPDIHHIQPDSTKALITIDKVRDLEHQIYQTPKRGERCFIVINPAEKMNSSASNALLKILEEPPTHAFFILIVEKTSHILPTILSRCQKYTFSDNTVMDKYGYIAIGKQYSSDTDRALLFKEGEQIIEAINQVIEDKISPCSVASLWNKYPIDDLFWWLYLVNAEAISYRMNSSSTKALPYKKHIAQLAEKLDLTVLFEQLRTVYTITKKINHNININATLALENFLLGYKV